MLKDTHNTTFWGETQPTLVLKQHTTDSGMQMGAHIEYITNNQC